MARPRPLLESVEQRSRGPVGSGSSQIRRHAAVEPTERADFVFGELGQAVLLGPCHKAAVHAPVVAAPPGQGGRLALPSFRLASASSSLFVVEPLQMVFGPVELRRRVERAGRRPHGAGHGRGQAPAHRRRQAVSAPDVARQQRELLLVEPRTARALGFGSAFPGRESPIVVADHDGVRGQVAQTLRACAQHHDGAAERPRRRGLQVDQTDQVANDRAFRRDGTAFGMQNSQAQEALARSASVQRLEAREIPPDQQKDDDDRNGSANSCQQILAAGEERRSKDDEDDRRTHQRRVHQEGGEAGSQIRQVVVQANVLRDFQANLPLRQSSRRDACHDLFGVRSGFHLLRRRIAWTTGGSTSRPPSTRLPVRVVRERSADRRLERRPMPEEGLEPPTRGL